MVPLMTNKNNAAIKFTRMERHGAGNGGSVDATRDGELVGEIVMVEDTRWVGMARTYVVGQYEVRDGEGETIAVIAVTATLTAVQALAAAKAALRARLA